MRVGSCRSKFTRNRAPDTMQMPSPLFMPGPGMNHDTSANNGPRPTTVPGSMDEVAGPPARDQIRQISGTAREKGVQ